MERMKLLILNITVNFMNIREILAKLGILRFGKIKWKVKSGKDLPYPAIDNSAFRNEDVMFDLSKKGGNKRKRKNIKK